MASTPPDNLKPSVWERVFVTLIFFCVVGFGLIMFQFNRPPFDLTKLQQVRKGMTQEQVRKILGEPRIRGEKSWVYSRLMAWRIVRVRFDANKRVESHEYDH